MAMHQNGMGDKEEKCIIVGWLEPFPGQAADAVVAQGMEGAGFRRFRQGTKQGGPEKFHYRRMLRENEVVHCLAVKKLELMAREMLR